MFRATKVKTMNPKRKTVIQFILLAILIFPFNTVTARHNAGQEAIRANFQGAEFTLINQIQGGGLGNNLTLQVKDWNNRTAFSGLNVTVRDSDKKTVDSKLSNGTGHVFLRLANGSYFVSVLSGNRLVGYQEINVTASEAVTIRTWAYDWNLTLADGKGEPLMNHEIFLYDQIIFQPKGKYTIVTNQVGGLVGKIKTDGNGTAHFSGTWNGTYRIKDANGGAYSWHILDIQGAIHVTLKPCNLTVKCVDQEDKSLPGHVVFLYDQPDFYIPPTLAATTNQTGLLLNWTKNDGNGTAYFTGVWNGTYSLKVVSGELVGKKIVNLQESDFFTMKCNETYMSLSFTTWLGGPLKNATVYIQNSAGHLLFRDLTDQNGEVFHGSMYLGSYTVFVEWNGTQVWSGVIGISETNDLTIKCPVYDVTFRFVDQFGNALRNTDVFLRKRISTSGVVTWGPYIKLETDGTGSCLVLLSAATYEVSCSQKIYSATVSSTVSSGSTKTITIICSIAMNIWLLAFLVATPLVGLTLILEWKKVKTPLVIKRYRNMLLKLGSLYDNGQVEYKIYRKLKEEYETKLMELGGREMK
jgi:hypothetical protein